MSKMMKLYRLNMDVAKGLNIGHFNPTCKAILKAMYRLEKLNADHDYKGSTGDEILKWANDHGLWLTRQAPEKFHTTWAYYVKKLKDEAGVIEVGQLRGMSTEEYLEGEDEETLEDNEPSDTDFDESGDEEEPEVHAQAAE
jgi:hypothetical protein